jgi:DNA-binding Xre family transcriptional regulator
MITFDRLWTTMKLRGISQYKLIKDYNFSSGQLDRLRQNQNVNTYTLNQLCTILDCNLEDIAEYKKDIIETTKEADH